MTSPEVKEARRRAAKKRWEDHPFDGPGMFDEAHRQFRLSFEQGHGCKACGDYIAVDQTRPDAQRRRDAERLRKRHYHNLALRSATKRAAQ